MSWAAIDGFQATRLREALAVVKAQHAKVLDPETGDWSTDLERLRDLLARTPDDQVPGLAARLSRRELLLAVDLALLESDPVVAKRAAILAIAARMKDVPARAWRFVATRGAQAGLEDILRGYAERTWLEKVVEAAHAERFIGWITASTLPRGLLEDRESGSLGTVEDWRGTLPELSTPLAARSPVWPQFWRTLLAEGSTSTLRREPPDALIRHAEALGEAAIDDFIVNYAVQLRSGRVWSERVLDWAARKRSEPSVTAPVGVWRRAEARSPGVVAELANWFALRTLEDFFRSIRDPHGRFEFWKQNFGRVLLGAEKLCGGEAAALVFPGLVVVEFGEHGNAAYVYPDSEVPWLKRRSAERAGDLKDRSRLIYVNGNGYRIIHRDGWQPLERSRMASVIRHFGRGS